MEIRDAILSDILYIDHLRAKESEFVGFIPRVRYEMEINGQRGGDILLVFENNAPVGFIYITYGPESAKIQQIAIQRDARRMERATALVEEVNRRTRMKGIPEIGCRCAQEFESNQFWLVLGFCLIAEGQGKSVYSRGKEKIGKRGRRINIYRRSSGLYEARLFNAL